MQAVSLGNRRSDGFYGSRSRSGNGSSRVVAAAVVAMVAARASHYAHTLAVVTLIFLTFNLSTLNGLAEVKQTI